MYESSPPEGAQEAKAGTLSGGSSRCSPFPGLHVLAENPHAR